MLRTKYTKNSEILTTNHENDTTMAGDSPLKLATADPTMKDTDYYRSTMGQGPNSLFNVQQADEHDEKEEE